MIGIPIGLLYANWGEWMIHKHILHGRGVNKKHWAAFHWHRHHKNCRRTGNQDRDFQVPWYSELRGGEEETGRTKEIIGLGLAALVHAPLFPVAPFFTGAVMYSIANYYYVHKKSHQDQEWARKHLPWHVDHHLGPNQHANWCVSKPWWDQIMGTREPYVGTEKEAADEARRAKNRERKAQKAARSTPATPAMSAAS